MNPKSSITVLRLGGEIDFSRRTEVRGVLQTDAGAAAYLLDLSEVTYADSTIIAELLRFWKEAAADKKPVALLIGNSLMLRLVQYAGLGEAFKIFEDRGEALSYLGGETA